MNHLGDANKMVGEDHLPDASKMVSDTPRTDDQECDMFVGVSTFTSSDIQQAFDFARQLERELNAANTEIEEKRKDVVWLATEKAKLENYVMLLEEWGDYMRRHSNNEWWCENWDKAKEAKL